MYKRHAKMISPHTEYLHSQKYMSEVTGCGHTRLVAAHKSYMRGVHLKGKLKYTEKAGAVVSQLPHCN